MQRTDGKAESDAAALQAAQSAFDETPCNNLALRQASRHLSQVYDRHLASTRLSGSQYSILSRLARLGPDIMLDPPDTAEMLKRFRGTDQRRELGDALLDQTLVAGIGNKWKAEALFAAGLSPWSVLGEVSDRELERALERAAELMRGATHRNRVYRLAGRPCPGCSARIRSWPQGETARMAYWCPVCQAGTRSPGA